MVNRKLRNITLSLIILAFLASAALVLSAKADSDRGIISVFYVWVKFSSLIASYGGVLILVLRVFRVIDAERNFFYSFSGMANAFLGIGGICCYIVGRINVSGVHDLLLNVLIGVIIMADILFFNSILKKLKL